MFMCKHIQLKDIYYHVLQECGWGFVVVNHFSMPCTLYTYLDINFIFVGYRETTSNNDKMISQY